MIFDKPITLCKFYQTVLPAPPLHQLRFTYRSSSMSHFSRLLAAVKKLVRYTRKVSPDFFLISKPAGRKPMILVGRTLSSSESGISIEPTSRERTILSSYSFSTPPRSRKNPPSAYRSTAFESFSLSSILFSPVYFFILRKAIP